jgi:hemolysin III
MPPSVRESCQVPSPGAAASEEHGCFEPHADGSKLSFATGKRAQTRAEEIANTISHGCGLLLALAAMPLLILQASRQGDAVYVAGASIFVTTMVLLYLASTLYHALPSGPAKRVFRVIEHSAIYLLIAGTYTPFMLGVLRGTWGWTLLGLVWMLAVAGVALKTLNQLSHPILSASLYLLMGWLIVVAANPLSARVPAAGLLWLLAGGMAYTAGVVFFAFDSRLRYGHFIWHLFVIAGTTCHYIAVYGYAA